MPATRRTLLTLAGAAAALLAVSVPQAAPRAPAPKSDRPNVVVIMTDDQTLESLRVMKRTLALLAAQGTTFDNAFASFPFCCPSRATFLTGQYSHNHGVVGNSYQNGLGRLDESSTLPVWLQAAGYSTIFVGKYLNEYGRYAARAVPPGWSEWYAAVRVNYYDHSMNRNGRIVYYKSGPRNYSTTVYTRTALDAVRRHAAGGKPFFLWLSYLAPHYGGPREPGDPPGLRTPVAAPQDVGRFANAGLPASPAFNEASVDDKPGSVRRRPPLAPEQVEALTASYRQRLESLLAVDRGVQQLVQALKRAGVLERTLIVFTSDNGYLQGEHRIPEGKQLVYEPSVRVPLLLRGPGVPRNLRLPHLVSNADVAPTILAAARVAPGRVQDGQSLLPLLADPSIEWGRDILFERGPGVATFDSTVPRLFTAIRTPRFVYAEHASGERELYDLVLDPYQLDNRAGHPAYAALEPDLAARLAALRDCAGAACNAGPQLALETPVVGDCVPAATLVGEDVDAVQRVEFAANGASSGPSWTAPFRVALAGQTRLRALAVLRDGRRVTLDATLAGCQ